MNALSWMPRKFRQNNDEQSRNVSSRKFCSSFSALWGLNEHQYYPEEKNYSTNISQPRVRPESSFAIEADSVEEVNEKETVDMSLEFFHTFLAIGTLGSISSIPEESMTPIGSMQTEAVAEENDLQSLKKLEKLNEKDVQYGVSNESTKGNVTTLNEKKIKGMDTKVKKSMAMCPLKELSEMPPTKEEARKQKPTLASIQFMKKMLKKLDFKLRCGPTSANICDSTEKKSTKFFRKSRKIHPEVANTHVTKSHNYEIKNMCHDVDHDKQVIFEVQGNMHPHDGMLKKETDSCYPTGEKAHWIKTDADYFVLEF